MTALLKAAQRLFWPRANGTNPRGERGRPKGGKEGCRIGLGFNFLGLIFGLGKPKSVKEQN